ncbi:RNA polymerase sigma factor [Carboxylicivirga taeanensis]|uniref:RNA polymerase sigma factor n=1 Tax=Carboxylicivirga taeanensis TaxID=1416875 RepID=UPI003F6DE69C
MFEERLIQRSKQGDVEAFSLLLDKYTRYLYTVVFRFVNEEEEAKDVVQDTFIVVWKKLKQYDSRQAKFTTWLYTIAVRQAIDTLRKRKPCVALSDNEISNYDIDRELSNKEMGELILKATKFLSPLQKVVFVLRDIEDLEVEEVKQVTGLTAKQIKDNLYVARKLIRARLEKYIII